MRYKEQGRMPGLSGCKRKGVSTVKISEYGCLECQGLWEGWLDCQGERGGVV